MLRDREAANDGILVRANRLAKVPLVLVLPVRKGYLILSLVETSAILTQPLIDVALRGGVAVFLSCRWVPGRSQGLLFLTLSKDRSAIVPAIAAILPKVFFRTCTSSSRRMVLLPRYLAL
jgi:hypothetical protein